MPQKIVKRGKWHKDCFEREDRIFLSIFPENGVERNELRR